jgi:MFS family permease
MSDSKHSAASPPTRARYVVLLFTLLLAAVAYLDRVCISTAAKAIKSDLLLSDTQMGFVFGAFTFAYALFEVPSGWLADRFGARLMLTRIVLWWSLMTAATGWVGGFASLFAARLLFGVGEAGTYPSISCVYARWLPERMRGRAFGAVVMTGPFAGAITQPLVVTLLGVVSWRRCFEIFGLVGVVWAVAWYRWFRDDPRRHRSVNAAEAALIGEAKLPGAIHPAVPWARLLRSRSLALLCLMYFAMIYGWYFYFTWLPSYLQRARGFNLTEAGWLSALPLIGIGTGVMAGGWLSDALRRRWGTRIGRRLPAMIGLPLAAGAIVGIIAITSPLGAVAMFVTAGALAALAMAPSWAVCLDIGKQHTGVVSGAMNMFGNFGGTLCGVAVGWCLDDWHSWNAPLYSIAVFYIVAAACWLGIDPEQPLTDE